MRATLEAVVDVGKGEGDVLRQQHVHVPRRVRRLVEVGIVVARLDVDRERGAADKRRRFRQHARDGEHREHRPVAAIGRSAV
eukprot:6210630-Pleurochrysis_carterae.AAC.5